MSMALMKELGVFVRAAPSATLLPIILWVQMCALQFARDCRIKTFTGISDRFIFYTKH
jgi:hypothetical protein